MRAHQRGLPAVQCVCEIDEAILDQVVVSVFLCVQRDTSAVYSAASCSILLITFSGITSPRTTIGWITFGGLTFLVLVNENSFSASVTLLWYETVQPFCTFLYKLHLSTGGKWQWKFHYNYA